MSEEEWRPVVGYEGFYSVSSEGRVRSEDRVVFSSTGPRRFKGRVLTPIKNGNHLSVNLSARDTSRKPHLVHRLVLTAFEGPCPPGKEGCHRNDVGSDNRLENLYWGTPSENMLDRVRNGRHPATKRDNCLRGHPLSGENLLPAKTRQCKVCSRAHSWRRAGKDFETALRYWEDRILG